MSQRSHLAIALISLVLVSCSAPIVGPGEKSNLPQTPGNFSATDRGAESIRLSWNFVETANEYLVYGDISASGAFSRLVYRGTLTECEDTGRSAETDYFYKLIATNGFGSSAASPVLGTRTLGYTPGIPDSLTASAATGSSVTINWSATANADSYRVYRDSSSTGAFTTLAYEGAALSFVDTTVVPDVWYFYKLAASNEFGSSQSTAPLQATAIPSSPSLFQATSVGKLAISLSWQASPTATSFRVSRDSNSSGTYVTVYEGPLLTYNDTGLSPSNLFNYRVSCRGSTVEQSTAVSLSATTLDLVIQDLRDPAAVAKPAFDTIVTLKNAYVTAIVPGLSGGNMRGFFLQANSVAPYSGLFVNTGNVPQTVFVGNRVSVIGTYDQFFSLDRISSVTSIVVADASTTLPFAATAIADPATIATGGVNSSKYQSMLVSVSGVTVTGATAVLSGSTDAFTVTGGLLVSDRLFVAMPAYSVSDTFVEIVGPLNLENNVYQVQPRSDDDLVD